MAVNPESPLDKLWHEYASVFKEFDDLKLARWMAQTLGQIEGRAWRLSHPLLGAYRLAAQTAHDRGIAVMRLATCPAAYTEAECCRAPLVPLLTRDVKESGLGCMHCGGTAVEFAEIPEPVRGVFELVVITLQRLVLPVLRVRDGMDRRVFVRPIRQRGAHRF